MRIVVGIDRHGRATAGAATGQGRARGAVAQRRTLDGAHGSASHNSHKRSIDFARIKEHVSLAMVLSHYGLLSGLKRAGLQLTGCCPIHSGSNPKQFLVNLNDNTWHCFGDCNRGGGGIDFVSLRERITPARAAQLLAEWFATSLPQQPQPLRRTSMTQRPSHRAYVVEDAEGDQSEQKGFWTKVGSAWPHKDGKGLNIQIIPGVAVSGRIVLREYTPEDEEADKKRATKRKA